MSYVVYHKHDTYYLKNHMDKGTYKMKTSWATERAAKAGLTRALKKNPNLKKEDFEIAESAHFHNKIEKTRTVRNLLNPERPFRIKVNTPASCDPSTETYHSM